jgi:PAS domain S-box-containing protein
VSNCSEALLGAVLLRRVKDSARTFDSFRYTVVFAGVSLCAPVLSSFLDAALVTLNGWGTAAFWTVWRTRVTSNLLATITIVPAMLTVAEHLRRGVRPPWRRLAAAALGLSAVVAICFIVFVRSRPTLGNSPALLYAPVPLLVGAAIGFGPLGASVSLLTCALVAIAGAVQGRGPFVASAPLDNALAIQSFLIIVWIPVMSLASILRERVQAERLARRNEEQLALAINAAQVGRWEWDIASGGLTWSAETRRMYEVGPTEPVTRDTFARLIHPDDRNLLATATADALAGRDVDVEFRVAFPDGRVKWILSRGKPLRDTRGDVIGLIGVKVDITARKTIDLLTEQQRRQLAQQSPSTVAGELSMALAHEMNQPLAAILTNAGTARRYLRHEPPDLQGLSELLEAIADDNRRAASIVTRYGTLSRRDPRRVRIELGEVIAGAARLAQGDLISRGVSITVESQPGLDVLGDPVQLQQVLLNLIGNACDAMDTLPAAARSLRLCASGDSRTVRISVEDSGPGVCPSVADRLFEPFVTTRPQRLGLGLAICRSLVGAHRGELAWDGESGPGARFSITLPASPAVAAGGHAASPARAFSR